MYLGRFHHIREPREVFVNGPNGQETKPSDYQPNQVEVEAGAWDLVRHVLRFEDKLIASMEHYPLRGDCGIHTYTHLGIEGAIRHMRQFYLDLYHTYSRPLSPVEIKEGRRTRDEGELRGSGEEDLSEIRVAQEIFMDQTKLEPLVRNFMQGKSWMEFIINTPFCTSYYQPEEEFFQQYKNLNNIGLIAYFDLTPVILPYLMRVNWLSLPPRAEIAIAHFLKTVLGTLPKPPKKSTQTYVNNHPHQTSPPS